MADGSSPVSAARVPRDEAIGIEDGGAFLAFAHMRADLQRLAKRKPVLRPEAALFNGKP